MVIKRSMLLAFIALAVGLMTMSLSPTPRATAAPFTTVTIGLSVSSTTCVATATVGNANGVVDAPTQVTFQVLPGQAGSIPNVTIPTGSQTTNATFVATTGFVGQVTIQAFAAGTTASQQLFVNCNNSTNSNLLINVTATPNALQCGGTTLIRANAVNQAGASLPDIGFVFSTTAGLLASPTPNSVILQLIPGAASATVTASAISITPANPADAFSVATSQIVTGTVLVQNHCTGEQYKALSVVATPNVVPCGGTSVITVTARDAAGHIINNVGYHFATDVGKLDVGPPNTALAIDNTAVLTVLPGMKTTTVTAWIGDQSSNPGKVTVQQYCKDADAETQGLTTTAPGSIKFTLSSPTVSCGKSIFVGVTVRDKNNQIVPDDTQVSFMTDSGSLSSYSGTTSSVPRPSPSSSDDNGSNSSGAFSSSNAFQGTPVKGALNFTFTADPFTTSGYATITAAAGANFGSTRIQINCQTAAEPITRLTSLSGPDSAAPAVARLGPCTPSGTSICIRPPSTGDAGLESGAR
jgi:hypothetical protein